MKIKEDNKLSRRFPMSFKIIKIIPKTTHKSFPRGKIGVESVMIGGNRDQDDNIVGENISMLHYTMFVISVGIGF